LNEHYFFPPPLTFPPPSTIQHPETISIMADEVYEGAIGIDLGKLFMLD
jgi:hypothetical protein